MSKRDIDRAATEVEALVTGPVGAPDETVRESLEWVIPLDSPVQRPIRWREGACCVCDVPVDAEWWVRMIDHRRQEALTAGLCSRAGCFRLLVAVVAVWTETDGLRRSVFGPARSLGSPVVTSWRPGW